MLNAKLIFRDDSDEVYMTSQETFGNEDVGDALVWMWRMLQDWILDGCVEFYINDTLVSRYSESTAVEAP